MKTSLFEGVTYVTLYDIIRTFITATDSEVKLHVSIRQEFDSELKPEDRDGHFDDRNPEHVEELKFLSSFFGMMSRFADDEDRLPNATVQIKV